MQYIVQWEFAHDLFRSIPMQFSSGMGQVSKSSYFASAKDVLMTTITKLKPEVVFQYGFR